MDADGSGQTRLTTNDAWDFLPFWSPDGAEIGFVSDRAGGQEIYAMRADGTEQRRLTREAAGNGAKDAEPSFRLSSVPALLPKWSPSGDHIAFHAYRGGNNWEIYVMRAGGGEMTRLTDNATTDIFPAWSPDGSRLTFASGREGNWEIYVMDPDGSGQTRLTFNSSGDVFPVWSPDGWRIAFMSDRDGNRELYAIDPDGSREVRLTFNDTDDGSHTWSPDGSKIAFDSDRDGARRIYVMNADGSEQVGLTGEAAGAAR